MDDIRNRINAQAGRRHELSRAILGIDWYDTESQARSVIEHIAEREFTKTAVAEMGPSAYERLTAEPTPAQDERTALAEALASADWSNVSIGNKVLIMRAIDLLTRPAQTEQQPVAFRVLRRNHDGIWTTDGRAWLDGVPDAGLLGDIAERSDQWRLEYAYAAPVAQPYPNRVAPHIDQFAEGVFVWYDEAALPGGAEPTLQAAQQAMAAYGESLNGPDNGGVCQTCGGDLVGDGYSTVRHCENLDVIGEGYEPDAGPLHCQEPTNG